MALPPGREIRGKGMALPPGREVGERGTTKENDDFLARRIRANGEEKRTGRLFGVGCNAL